MFVHVQKKIAEDVVIYDFDMHNPAMNPTEDAATGEYRATDTNVIERIRRDPLEHATLHMLAKLRIRGGGYATPNGFYIAGDFDIEQLAWAANEAIRRLNAGESHLAVHPGCGTNLATAGVLTGVFGFLTGSMVRRGRSADRLTWTLLGAMVGASLAQPIGPWMQTNVTTSADMHGMRICAITRTHNSFLGLPAHFIQTEIV